MSDQKIWIKIKELENISGVPRSTIHFYLRAGLLHQPTKTGKTMAYYDKSHLERLKTIQRMKKDLRLPTEFIKRQLESSQKNGGKTDLSVLGTYPDMSLKEQRKTQIIEAAIRLFSNKGYHRTNVKDIADAAGMSTGTFYIYYRNKRDLFIEVVDSVVRKVLGNIAGAIRKEKDPEKRLMLRAKVFFDNYPKYSEILNQLRAEIAGDDPWARERVKKIYLELTEPLIRESKKFIESGFIRAIDPDLAAYALIGLVDVMAIRASLDNKYKMDDIAAFLRDFVMNGLKPSK